MVQIATTVTVSDAIDANPVVRLVSITCNDSCEGADFGTDDRHFALRAPRTGSGSLLAPEQIGSLGSETAPRDFGLVIADPVHWTDQQLLLGVQARLAASGQLGSHDQHGPLSKGRVADGCATWLWAFCCWWPRPRPTPPFPFQPFRINR